LKFKREEARQAPPTKGKKSAEKHEKKKRATNKQHGMCFVENAKQFLCDAM
jgi:hypothetical protein